MVPLNFDGNEFFRKLASGEESRLKLVSSEESLRSGENRFIRDPESDPLESIFAGFVAVNIGEISPFRSASRWSASATGSLNFLTLDNSLFIRRNSEFNRGHVFRNGSSFKSVP